MMKAIKIKGIEDVNKINRFATRCDHDVFVHGTTEMIDAKSLLGLMTLVGKENLRIVFPDNLDPKRVCKALDRAKI